MAGDIASLLRRSADEHAVQINLRTVSAALKSGLLVQVFASTHQGHGLFSINLETKVSFSRN